jgi:hypothetical protein
MKGVTDVYVTLDIRPGAECVWIQMSAEMVVTSVMITLCAPILQAAIHAPVKQVILEMDSHVLYYNSITLVALDIGAGAECVWISMSVYMAVMGVMKMRGV